MSTAATPSLKTLQLQRSHVAAEVAMLANEYATMGERLQRLRVRLGSLDAQLAACTAGPAQVSEHALVRYVERVLGYDLDVLREAILPPRVREQVERLGSGVYPVLGGAVPFRVVVQRNIVVTIKTPTEEP